MSQIRVKFSEEFNYYDVLNVKRDATKEQIKGNYRKLAQVFHPDKGGDTEQFKKLNEAYTILSTVRFEKSMMIFL